MTVMTVRLTSHQHRVLNMMAHGLTDREISERIGVSLFTVRSHVQHMRERFKTGSRVVMVLEAERQGMLKEE